MRFKPRKWLTIALASVAFAVVSAVVVYNSLPALRLHSLRQACDAGDRIVVDTNPFPLDMRSAGHLPDTAKYEIVGTDNVAVFLQAIALERSFKSGGCKCFGDIKFTVYRGDTELAELSIQHEKAMRWWGGRWSGDQPLTQSGRDALSTFLVANGCPTAGEAKAVFNRARESLLHP